MSQDSAQNQLTLTAIGLEEGTDKAYRYTKEYDKLFSPLRYSEGTLLEIGVAWLSSIRMWHRYFPRYRIYGIDRRRFTRPWMIIIDLVRLRSDIFQRYDFSGKLTLIRADQSKIEDLQRAYKIINEPLDIIIDDGSHIPEHQILSFNCFYPLLKPGGYYIIEDVFQGSPLYSFLSKYKPQEVGEGCIENEKALVIKKN